MIAEGIATEYELLKPESMGTPGETLRRGTERASRPCETVLHPCAAQAAYVASPGGRRGRGRARRTFTVARHAELLLSSAIYALQGLAYLKFGTALVARLDASLETSSASPSQSLKLRRLRTRVVLLLRVCGLGSVAIGALAASASATDDVVATFFASDLLGRKPLGAFM